MCANINGRNISISIYSDVARIFGCLNDTIDISVQSECASNIGIGNKTMLQTDRATACLVSNWISCALQPIDATDWNPYSSAPLRRKV